MPTTVQTRRREFLLLLCSITIALVSTMATSSQTGVSKRITGGRLIDVQKYPFLVTLHLPDNGLCGGTLITNNCVLTAAHCVFQTLPSDIQVYTANKNQSYFGELRLVEKISLPKAYSHDQLDMDVAIVKLQQPFKRTDAKTIKIDFRRLNEDDKITVAGWGNTEHIEQLLCRRVYDVKLTVLSHSNCKGSYAGLASISRHMFCAEGNTAAKDACLGDSGGPAIRNGKQVGIVSFGYGCGIGYPGVYTRLSTQAISHYVQQTLSDMCGEKL